MSKRFTETTKWNDPWYRKLGYKNRDFWNFLLDHCDGAGFWKKDFETAEYFLGYQIDEDASLAEFNKGKVRVENRREYWEILDFISFQYGKLSKECKGHTQVFVLLEKYKNKGYVKGIDTLMDMDKEKDKYSKDGVEEEGDLSWPISYLNQLLGTRYSTKVAANTDLVKARYSEGRTQNDFKTVIDKKVAQWQSDKNMSKYLRPETLFNRTKFESYLNEIDTHKSNLSQQDEWKSKANKDCTNCRGTGAVYAPGSGKFGKCGCVK